MTERGKKAWRIVWDRLSSHRSWLVQEYIGGLQGWISTVYPPPTRRN
jgi:hypothetical protein